MDEELRTTLAELLILVIILGIIAAIVIPNTAISRCPHKRTMPDMRTIASAIEAYRQDSGHYPNVTTITQLIQVIDGPYLASAPAKDGWRRPFVPSTSLYPIAGHAALVQRRGPPGHRDPQQYHPQVGPDPAEPERGGEGVYSPSLG